jgi:hypothetical protein
MMSLKQSFAWRLLIAMLVTCVFQTAAGWSVGDFMGRSLTTALVVALSFPVERWARRRFGKHEAK